MKWKNGPQGLKFRDLVVGTGATPRKGQQVTVHYTGKLQKNGKQFDSSVGRAPPCLCHAGGSSDPRVKPEDDGVWEEGAGQKRQTSAAITAPAAPSP